ncbi:MAG: LysM peptidoglycan-binding domain-containing protein [Gammaproteobacteria bacterium]|nr:LysM peptidoglycan-binding domain-containing protein [Gammaproteobacteria bacterium]
MTVNPDHPDKYVVQKGDTLWDISGKFLQQPWLWPEVWRANPQIIDPHLIYPGDIISLTYEDGKPILALERGGRTISGRNVRLSPTVRSYEKEEAIPTIPVDAIKQFLTRPLVVSEKEMETWPYIVSSYDEHLVAGSGNKIYVRGLPDESTAKRYAIYRKGKPYFKGETYLTNYREGGSFSYSSYTSSKQDDENILGYEALYVGDAIIEKPGDPASAIVALSNREVLNGDRLAEESETDISTNFIPTSPDHEVNGNIISVIDGVTEIGQYQVVVLDLGTSDGMEVGNVVGVFKSGKIVKDYVATAIKAKEEDARRLKFEHEDTSAVDRAVSNIANDIRDTKRAFDRTDLAGYLGRPNTIPEKVELPEEYAGVLMVFRTFEKVSYALVMEAISPIHIYDSVRNL